MGKYLLYCQDCDEEVETNSKKGKCPLCGGLNTFIENLVQKSKKHSKRDYWENSPRRQF